MDKEQLLKPRLPEATVEVEGVGTFRVRGLSRGEVLELTPLAQSNEFNAFEVEFLSRGIVEPKLTPEEVGEWRNNATSAEIDPVSTKIMELTGLGGADKQAATSFPGGDN